mmetsp:Transcript_24777/g.60869  ORF Transcript_24777/g.60869 Transcript_24777/m.60869 type:complete len:125 (-) Transcript_24777:31-405(-)
MRRDFSTRRLPQQGRPSRKPTSPSSQPPTKESIIHLETTTTTINTTKEILHLESTNAYSSSTAYPSSNTKVLMTTADQCTQSQSTRSTSSWSTASTSNSFIGSGSPLDDSVSEEDEWGYFVDHD